MRGGDDKNYVYDQKSIGKCQFTTVATLAYAVDAHIYTVIQN